MGVIKRQSIKGTIYSYVGTVIGFITSGLLFPKFLSTERIGLLSLLASYSSLFAVFASLGFNSVIIRLFPYFRDESKRHNGFFFLTAAVTAAGYILSIILFILLKPLIIKDSIEQSHLFIDYLYLVPPLILFLLVFSMFDSYNRALFNATYGTFLTEVFQRLVIFLITVLFVAGFTGFNNFVILYAIALSLPGILIFYPIILKRQVFFDPGFEFINKSLRKDIFNVSAFGIIVGFSNVIIQRIDTIMINSMIDLSTTGIYTISLLFGGIVSLPSRSINRISTTVIADAWKSSDIGTIKSIYFKSCLNQTIIGSLVFAGIWANISNVFHILPAEYLTGKYVIFFFGLSALFTMISGISSSIINLSKEYRYNTYFTFAFGLMIVITNLIMIPKFGMVGAAIAAVVSNLTFHLMHLLFLYIKFGLFPYDKKIVIVLLIAVISYIINLFLPELSNFVIDIIYRSSLMTIIFIVLIVLSKVSIEVDEIKTMIINKVLSFFR